MKDLFVSLLFSAAREARTKFPLGDISMDPLISRALEPARHPISRSRVQHNKVSGLWAFELFKHNPENGFSNKEGAAA